MNAQNKRLRPYQYMVEIVASFYTRAKRYIDVALGASAESILEKMPAQ